MKIDFITTNEDAQKTIPVRIKENPLDYIAGNVWEDIEVGAVSNIYPNIMKKVKSSIEKKKDEIESMAELQREGTENHLGNRMFHITGKNTHYLLKILGQEKKWNKREILIWKHLGFDSEGMTVQGKEEVPGLPHFVHIFEQYYAILMPFYFNTLKAVPGGFELPLVLNVLMYLGHTLEGLHNSGILFMDFQPFNILFEKRTGHALEFFLTDMGGARPICKNCLNGELEMGVNWKDMHEKQQLCSNWTMRMVKPPHKLFSQNKECPDNLPPAYDYYTLARCVQILSGFSFDPEESVDAYQTRFSSEALQSYSGHFCIEEPVTPFRNEVKRFYELLEKPLFKKQAVDREAALSLFKSFFMYRARFAAAYIDDPETKKVWKSVLTDRLNLYLTALEDKERESFKKEFEQAFIGRSMAKTMEKELELINLVPKYIKKGQYQEADNCLAELSTGFLIKASQTAQYSYSFHRKLLQRIFPGDRLKSEKPKPVSLKLPEKETLAQAHKQKAEGFRILSRVLKNTRTTNLKLSI